MASAWGRLWFVKESSRFRFLTFLDGCPMFPGFPVESGGAGELHAAFLIESRTRDHR